MKTMLLKKSKLIVYLSLLLFSFENIAQTTGDYKSNVPTGNWTSLSTWQTYNGSTWIAATAYPGQIAGSYETTITSSNNITLNTTLINTFPTLNINGTLTLNTNGATYNVNVSTVKVNAGGTIYYGTKGTLALPVNAIITVGSGGLSGSCTNNQTIMIGGVTFANCVGGGSTGYTFLELMNLGGTINTIANSNSPICSGGTINLTGAVSGAVNTSNLTYSWKITSPSGGITTIAAQNTSVTNAAVGIYTCVLTCTTNYNGVTYTNAETISVMVNPLTIISVQPIASQTLCQNTTASSLSVTATGAGTLTYVWHSNTINSTIGGTVISGATTSNYTPPSATTGATYYYCSVTGTCGTTTTTIASVNVNATTSITSESVATQSICLGKTPAPLYITALGSALTYQWYSNTSNSTTGGTPISGATTSSYIPETTTTGTTYFYCIITGTCGIVTSSITMVTIGGTATWNGTTWDTTPSTISTLYINGNYSTTGNIQGCSCMILSGNVVINSGDTMSLENELNTTNGTFTLNNNGNLIQLNPVSNIGNIKVKRNSNALMRLDYTLWSSPVDSQNLLAFSPNTLSNRFYKYNTPTDTYLSIVPSSNSFTKATGYLIRTPNNFPTTPTVWTGIFTGNPNNGNINLPLSTSGNKYNAIGNPYPSPLNLLKFASDNIANITGTLYFWRETNNNTLNIAYSTWAGGTFVTNANNGQGSIGIGGTEPNNMISQGQGFIVQGSATGTEVVFNNEQRIDNHADHFFKNNKIPTSNEEFNRIWLNLTNTTGAFYQMAIGYNSNATNEIDFNDGKSLGTGPIALNTYVNTTNLAIQGKALPFNENDVIPLSYRVTDAGNYTIAIDHKDGMFTDETQDIYIKDNWAQTYNQINTTSYTFASTMGTYFDRFELVFKNPSLQTSQSTFTNDSVIVYKKNETIFINSSNTTMKSIKAYDIRGRLLLEKENINTTETKINVGNTNEIILIKVMATDKSEITKKVVN